MNYIFDIINLEFIIAIVFLVVAYYLRKEPFKVFLLFCHIGVILLLNDVLFSSSYFGDQWGYFLGTKTMRHSLSTLSFREISGFSMVINDAKVTGIFNAHGLSSLIFSLVPVPFIKSLHSVSMINFLLFLFLFVFIKKKFINNNSVDYFLLLFPSLLLYSSLALRDTLVLVIMFFTVYFIVIKEKKILGLIIGFPLLYLKFQNYSMIIMAVMLYTILERRSIKINIALFLAILIVIFFPERIPVIGSYYSEIERLRFALTAENMIKITGKFYDWEAAQAIYEPLGTGFSLVYLMAKNFIYMLFKPLPWECRNPFQIIQSVENITVFILIIIVNREKIICEVVRQKILFLNILLFISMSINGLVVINFGAAVRYKFTFIVIYFVFYYLLLHYDKLLYSKYLKNIRLSSPQKI